MSNKVQFRGRIGLVAATVGSAVGLGNVWRFPAEAQANGGAAFLIIYIICVALLGIPVMLSEFSLGRGTGKDAMGAYKKLAPRSKWWLNGILAIVASYLILSFYMVVAGWTFEYFWQSLTGELFSFRGTGEVMVSSLKAQMEEYVSGPWEPLMATYVMIAINILVLLKGVQRGIEKISNLLMPLLFILLVLFCLAAMTLPKAEEGLVYFFNPDFTKITPSTLVNALGQAFFSLSLGMGILITYSSYYPNKTNLVSTAATVSFLDLGVAILMGMIIFPAVMSFGLDGESLEGATLVFITLPEVFASMPFPRFWSSLFFLLLMVAALTSTISLAEVSISFVSRQFSLSRKKACLVVMLPLIVLSSVSSLSQGVLQNIRILDKNIFDFLDTVATNFMLPLSALLACVFLGWFVKRSYFGNQLTNNGRLNKGISKLIIWIIRFVAPVLITVILVAKILE